MKIIRNLIKDGMRMKMSERNKKQQREREIVKEKRKREKEKSDDQPEHHDNKRNVGMRIGGRNHLGGDEIQGEKIR